MTDNEIIKAWKKILATGDAPVGEHWSVGGVVTTLLAKETFDMLNRQKAEIERLKRYDEERDIALHARLIANAKTEAIREFAENVKTAINERFSDEIQDSNSHLYLMNTLLDDLVKGMTEGGAE